MNHAPEREHETILVIGGGMVAQRFAEQMVERDGVGRYRIEILSEEAHLPYDRVHLTSYLRERRPEALQLVEPDWYEAHGVAVALNTRVVAVDSVAQQVSTHAGAHRYDHLVLATGSRPFVPPIPNCNLDGVFVYRTIDDLERIAVAATKAKTAAVIGGGLLGLEAAKALVDLGLKTHVIETAPRLMPRQLDARGAQLLTSRIQELGIEIHLSANVVKVHGEGAVRAVELAGEAPIDVDLLVISAGIRPCDELAKNAGIVCGARGGILIDDTLKTSHYHVYAIGECALHRDAIYGLAAPGYAMAETLARRFAGELDATFVGTDQSAKLKLLGVHVASAGNPFADEASGRSVVLDNFASGVYRKVVLDASATRVFGAILVGDTELYGRLLSHIRSGKPLDVPAESLLFADHVTAGKQSSPELDDLVCTCNGVTAGCLSQAIRTNTDDCSVETLKKHTRAGTGCGGCLPQVAQLLSLELARLGKARKPRICEHFDYTRQELFDLVRVRSYRSFEELLAAHGHGAGCEVCKPAVASILASVHNEHVLEHAHLQDTNDRFLANIQRRGLYSIVPRIPGGEITPRKLAAIAEVADRFGLYTKITGGQRIDLFGARLDQLPTIWQELIKAGFESGHAYGKALRTVKSCVGSTWCRFGLNDSVSFAIRVEN
ncbi:MAG TPA: nitrite reductase large subunit NirB, partial [Polyangiaceae bacterium]|nr:nitrite reductase large subunit NirB [Polyangiaceae bacterium]